MCNIIIVSFGTFSELWKLNKLEWIVDPIEIIVVQIKIEIIKAEKPHPKVFVVKIVRNYTSLNFSRIQVYQIINQF